MCGIHMRSKTILFAFLTVFAAVFSAISFPVQANPARQWASDRQVPGYLEDTFTPFLLADQNRTVHAFTSQWIDDGSRRLAVVYRKWSLAGGWTRPIDVLLAPSGNATFLGAFLDVSGTIHVVFAQGENRKVDVYYSFTRVETADSASAWSTPVLIGPGLSGVNSVAMSGDLQGNLAVIYSGNLDGNGVYAVHSSDAGRGWSDPIQLFTPKISDLIPYSLRLFSGRENQLQAAWNVVSTLGVDEELYFSNYDIESGNWAKPVELEERTDSPDYFGPSFPAIVDNGAEIVIMYNGGNPFAGLPVGYGRPVQRVTVSTNGGQSWSEAINPFPFHVGRSGEHSLALDGVGRPHALFVQRIETLVDGQYSIVGGIWHSIFENGSWTNPDRFVTTYSPHDVRSIIVQGNVLLVVWREDPGEGTHGIWYSYFVLDVPELPVVPISTINPTPAVTNNNIAVGNNTPVAVIATPTPVKLTDSQREILDGSSNPASPIIIGMIPVVIVLASVLLMYRYFRVRQ
jgi:hypothetical protein